MITIENRSAVRMDGQLIGCIPPHLTWYSVLLELGAAGGFRTEGNCTVATPLMKYRDELISTLRDLAK